MKPAEAESSSGLRDHQTRLTNFEPTTTIFPTTERKKNNSAALHRQQLPRHTDSMLRQRRVYQQLWQWQPRGAGNLAAAAACVQTTLAVAATWCTHRGARQVETTTDATTSDTTMKQRPQTRTRPTMTSVLRLCR